MTDNIFLDKSPKPSTARLKESLGARFDYWEELKNHVDGQVVEEWKYYGQRLGWTLKLFRGKRNLLFLSARKGSFVVSFVFGDKAVAYARKSALSKELVRELDGARKFAEGRGIQVDVRSRRALEQAKILVDIKLSA